MKLPTFWGGIHPPQNKDLTADEKIEHYLPTGELVFPMPQNIGAPNAPVVAKGDRVLVGTRLGNNDAFVSAPVLSSVSGTVKDVTLRMTTPGTFENCVVVENDGLYEKAPEWQPLPDYENIDPKEYLKRIREAGIVGFGGATFPTAVKLSPPPDKKIKWLIVNGVECEPYLNCDNRIMLESPDEVVHGLRLMLRLFPEAQGIIAIENNKPAAIKTMEEAVARLGAKGITVQPLAVKYPQGAEKMLIEALTGQEYVMTALPADVGCIILNVRTTQQIYRAIRARRARGDARRHCDGRRRRASEEYFRAARHVGARACGPLRRLQGAAGEDSFRRPDDGRFDALHRRAGREGHLRHSRADGEVRPAEAYHRLPALRQVRRGLPDGGSSRRCSSRSSRRASISASRRRAA